jgi:trigger factor
MQITETLNEGLKRAYQITITAHDLESRVRKAGRGAARDRDEGLPQGQGADGAAEEAVRPAPHGRGDAGGRRRRDAGHHFEETGDRPAMQPEVKMVNEDWKEGDDVVVEMSYEKLPEIPEVDYKSASSWSA